MEPSEVARSGAEIVTAAEIAAWVYCPEQWCLVYGMGHEPGSRQARRAGTRPHEKNVAAERAPGCAMAVASGAAAAGLLIALAWLLRR
jgi:hypothetical protein